MSVKNVKSEVESLLAGRPLDVQLEILRAEEIGERIAQSN